MSGNKTGKDKSYGKGYMDDGNYDRRNQANYTDKPQQRRGGGGWPAGSRAARGGGQPARGRGSPSRGGDSLLGHPHRSRGAHPSRGPPRGPFRGGPRNYPPGPYFEGPMRPPHSWFPEMEMGPEEYYPEEYYEEPYEEFMEGPSYFSPRPPIRPRGRGGRPMLMPARPLVRGPPGPPMGEPYRMRPERDDGFGEEQRARPGGEGRSTLGKVTGNADQSATKRGPDFGFLFPRMCHSFVHMTHDMRLKFDVLVTKLQEDTSVIMFEEALKELELQGMSIFHTSVYGNVTCHLYVQGILVGKATSAHEGAEGEFAAYEKMVAQLGAKEKGGVSPMWFLQDMVRLDAAAFDKCTGVNIVGSVIPDLSIWKRERAKQERKAIKKFKAALQKEPGAEMGDSDLIEGRVLKMGKEGGLIGVIGESSLDLETLKPKLGHNLVLFYTDKEPGAPAKEGWGQILAQSASFSDFGLRYSCEPVFTAGDKRASCSIFINNNTLVSSVNGAKESDATSRAEQGAYGRLHRICIALKVNLKKDECVVVNREDEFKDKPGVFVTYLPWLRWVRLGKVHGKFDHKQPTSTEADIKDFESKIHERLSKWFSDGASQPALFIGFGTHEMLIIQDEARKLKHVTAPKIILDGAPVVAAFSLGKSPFEFATECWNRGPAEGDLFAAHLFPCPLDQFVLSQSSTSSTDEDLLRQSAQASGGTVFIRASCRLNDYYECVVGIDGKKLACGLSVNAPFEAKQMAFRQALERLKASCYVLKRKYVTSSTTVVPRESLFKGEEVSPMATGTMDPELGDIMVKGVLLALETIELGQTFTLEDISVCEQNYILEKLNKDKYLFNVVSRNKTKLSLNRVMTTQWRLRRMVEEGITENSYCRITKPIIERGVSHPSMWQISSKAGTELPTSEEISPSSSKLTTDIKNKGAECEELDTEQDEEFNALTIDEKVGKVGNEDGDDPMDTSVKGEDDLLSEMVGDKVLEEDDTAANEERMVELEAELEAVDQVESEAAGVEEKCTDVSQLDSVGENNVGETSFEVKAGDGDAAGNQTEEATAEGNGRERNAKPQTARRGRKRNEGSSTGVRKSKRSL